MSSNHGSTTANAYEFQEGADAFGDVERYDEYDETNKGALTGRLASLGTASSTAMIAVLGICIGAVGAWIIDSVTGSSVSRNTVEWDSSLLSEDVKKSKVDENLLGDLEGLAGNTDQSNALDEEINFDLGLNDDETDGNISRFTQGAADLRRNSNIGRAAALSDVAAWRRYAVAPPASEDLPIVSVVIDDVTQPDDPVIKDFLKLGVPLTFSVVPTAQGVGAFAVEARNQGNELLVDIPMETDTIVDTGPNTISTDLDKNELNRRLEWSLRQFDEFVGINSYEGNVATADAATMQSVMETVRDSGLMYLESRTSPRSQALTASQKLDIPNVKSDLDATIDASQDDIQLNFEQALKAAKGSGAAVITIPPTANALSALQAWLEDGNTQSFVAVPLTTVVKLRQLGNG